MPRTVMMRYRRRLHPAIVVRRKLLKVVHLLLSLVQGLRNKLRKQSRQSHAYNLVVNQNQKLIARLRARKKYNSVLLKYNQQLLSLVGRPKLHESSNEDTDTKTSLNSAENLHLVPPSVRSTSNTTNDAAAIASRMSVEKLEAANDQVVPVNSGSNQLHPVVKTASDKSWQDCFVSFLKVWYT